MTRFIKLSLILAPSLLLLAVGVVFFTRPTLPGTDGDPAAASGGKLVVLVVFDQMRGDYLERWATAFGPDGFERIKKEGTWYANVSLPYACSATGPGHASLATGANPRVHGIIENEWYDRNRGTRVYSSADDRVYPNVPQGNSGPGLAPTRLLAPTFSEALKAGTNGRGRLFSLSLKGRAAVLLGGKEPSGVYTFDNGEFHTSTFYRDRLPVWVEQFNSSGTAKRWAGQTWDRFGKGNYDTLAGPDNQPGEFATNPRLPRTLPAGGAEYFTALEASPFGNELLWEFAKTAMDAEKLGRNGSSDVLCISFSSNDVIGHLFGPDSHEVLDVTLRSDALLANIIRHLDDTLGGEHYTLLVTADHGIAPLPEFAARTNPEAGRISEQSLIGGLHEVLDDAFGRIEGNPGRWVESDFKLTKPWVYLNRRLIDAVGVPYPAVESFTAKWLANRDAVLTTFTRTRLIEGRCLPEEKPLFDAVVNAFHPDRSGDVMIVIQPYKLYQGLGVDHGSVHGYDRQVFLLALGADVPKQGKRTAPFNWLSIPTLMARSLKIEPPAKAPKALPEGW